jgi:hypothetical protein
MLVMRPKAITLSFIALLLSVLVIACAGESTPEPLTPGDSDPAALPAVEEPTLAPPAVVTVTTTALPAPSTPTADAVPAATNAAPGAIIGLSMRSQVGFLLDDFPAGTRESVASALAAQPEAYWLAHAEAQVQLMKLRLNFRDFVYEDRGQLPLPPRSLWRIALDSAGPSRVTIQGHELLMWDYAFTSTLLTDVTSPPLAEPALADVGGTWDEPFIFPADPTLLLQRTGNACINEGGFPPESFDSENIWHFYDYECTADSGGALGCHRTVLPAFSCREALQARVGEVETSLRFERLPWNDVLANAARIGQAAADAPPDLSVVESDLGTNRIVYRFVETDDCALEEDAVAAAGWRRLLQFDATVANVGGQALHIGPVIAEDDVNNVFDYSPCHDHFHYSYYGEFFLEQAGELEGSKQAFCVQSTSRYENHESAPLIHEYTCRFQGIQAGWVDEYVAGLDAQWMDITELTSDGASTTVQLGFRANPDRFLCEGTPIVDDTGTPLWETTGAATEAGEPINRPQCTFLPEWERNNLGVLPVEVPASGSFVTQPCLGSEIGPMRNCGFVPLLEPSPTFSCQAGDAVTLSLDMVSTAPPTVFRVCEASAALGQGIACTFNDAVRNVVVEAPGREVSFACPAVRDAAAGTGGFALFTAPVWPQDALEQVQVTTGP